MMKNIALVLRCIAMATIALVGSTAEGSAQEQGGFFVEPEVRAMRLLDETAPVVGLRIGHARPNGLGFDLGGSALVGSPSRNPGPFRGDTIQRLGRLFLALRYDGVFTDRLRFDLGGVVGLGYADAEICEGTDVCVLSSGYVGGGPEAGATILVGKRFGIRLSGRYAWSPSLSEFEAPSVGVGLRVWP